MHNTRVIPVLLFSERRLVKGNQFKDHRYVGDPMNAIKIFNDKEVDEMLLLDIFATKKSKEPDFDYLEKLSSEAFFPIGYGGGVTSLEHVKRITRLGFEKIIFGHEAYRNPDLISSAVDLVGSQSVIVCMDYKKTFLKGKRVFTTNGSINTGFDPIKFALRMQELGVGELIVSSIDHEGTYLGYDLITLKEISSVVSIPIVASGGASSVQDFVLAKDQAGVQAVAAGSLFIFFGPHKAVLINYPEYQTLNTILNNERMKNE